MLSPFMTSMSKIPTIKKVETILPVAQKTAHVTPLLVGDDLSLRSSLTSPIGYDREMVKMLHQHSEFVEQDTNIKYPLNKFNSELSNIDKISLLWALYKSTYDILGSENRTFRCPKRECNNEFKDTIYLDDLIHDDTYILWDQEKPFYEFFHVIPVKYEDFTYEFLTRLPSILDNNRLLGMISIEILQNNLNTIGAIFTRPQQMALLTKAIRVNNSKDIDFQTVETDKLEEILLSFQNYVPHIVSEEFFKRYSEVFDKYVPKYYKDMSCPVCGHNFKFEADLELEFFRRSFGLKTLMEPLS